MSSMSVSVPFSTPQANAGDPRGPDGRPRQPEPAPDMIGTSPAMQHMREAMIKIATSEAPVLVTGESGTGKEVAAQTVHRLSVRAAGPFIAINCAAIPATLIASELFGHEKGAFTGATHRRIGRIQLAHGGTLFLDEIGDLPLDLQAHLLRFLQEGTVDPVGGSHPVKVDVRVIAATNVPLRRAVAESRFRTDLFYRLNVLRLDLPPLRQRGDDALLLARHFLARFAAEGGGPRPELSPSAETLIRSHPWPGNVRELLATMRRAVVMADGPVIWPEDLGLGENDVTPPPPVPADGETGDGGRPDPATVRTPADTGEDPGAGSETGLSPLEAARRDAEKPLIRKALLYHRGNITRAAEGLGVSRVTLYRLLEKYAIPVRPNGAD